MRRRLRPEQVLRQAVPLEPSSKLRLSQASLLSLLRGSSVLFVSFLHVPLSFSYFSCAFSLSAALAFCLSFSYHRIHLTLVFPRIQLHASHPYLALHNFSLALYVPRSTSISFSHPAFDAHAFSLLSRPERGSERYESQRDHSRRQEV